MTTEAERLAIQIETHAGAHWLARDAAGMIRKQAAEIERLKSDVDNLSDEVRIAHADAKDKVERADAMLRQALEALNSIPEDMRYTHQDDAITEIKQHVEDTNE